MRKNSNTVVGLVFIGLASIYLFMEIGVFPRFDFWDLAWGAAGLSLLYIGIDNKSFYGLFFGIAILLNLLNNNMEIPVLGRLSFLNLLLAAGLLGVGFELLFGGRGSEYFKQKEDTYFGGSREKYASQEHQATAPEDTGEEAVIDEVIEVEVYEPTAERVVDEIIIEADEFIDADDFDSVHDAEIEAIDLEVDAAVIDAIFEEKLSEEAFDELEADVDEAKQEKQSKQQQFQQNFQYEQKNANHEKTTFTHNGSNDYRQKYYQGAADSRDNVVYITALFNGVKKFVRAPEFEGGDLRTTFGNLNIDFTQSTLSPDGARLTVQCSFGKTTIYVPRTWAVVNNMSISLGTINDDRGFSNDVTHPRLEIYGQVTFGEVVIIYV